MIRGSRGFSVVEIIVILAMLGLVIAVGAPAFLRHQGITGARTCQENLTRIEAALEAYLLDHSLTHATAATVDQLIDTTGTGRLAALPQCPAGGTYTIAQGHAACSIGKNPAAPYAPHLYTTRLPYTGDKE